MIAVVIGRFSPFHKGHLHLIKTAFKDLTDSDKLLILIGSANRAPTSKNPWTAAERHQIISSALNEEKLLDHKIRFNYIQDYYYSDIDWIEKIQSAVYNLAEKNEKIVLYGYIKDQSSYYLKLFPAWDFINIEQDSIHSYNATDIREDIFKYIDIKDKIKEKSEKSISYQSDKLCFSTNRIINDWCLTNEALNISKEYFFYQQYKEETKKYKYPITYVTVDSLIYWKGHILLIERKNHPGKGLLALPGGFIEHNERLIEGAIRETKEETNLTIEPNWQIGYFTADAPFRSLRGRTISHCFAFQIPDKISFSINPPIVEGKDDAIKAQWRSIREIKNDLYSQMFEDHWDIINIMSKNFKRD